jgi:hypothetical protein
MPIQAGIKSSISESLLKTVNTYFCLCDSNNITAIQQQTEETSDQAKISHGHHRKDALHDAAQEGLSLAINIRALLRVLDGVQDRRLFYDVQLAETSDE